MKEIIIIIIIIIITTTTTRMQLLEDLRNKRRYWELNNEAEDPKKS